MTRPATMPSCPTTALPTSARIRPSASRGSWDPKLGTVTVLLPRHLLHQAQQFVCAHMELGVVLRLRSEKDTLQPVARIGRAGGERVEQRLPVDARLERRGQAPPRVQAQGL